MQIPYALLTLTAVFGFVVAWCLNQIWKLTFGAFFTWLGKLGLSIPIPGAPNPTIHPFDFLLGFNDAIQGFFSGMVATSEHAMVRLFHAAISAFGALAGELGALAQALERRIVGIVSAVVPAALRAARGLIGGALKRLHGLQLTVQHLLGQIERKVQHGIAQALAFAYRQLRHAGKYAAGLAASVWKSVRHFGLRLAHLEKKLVGRGSHELVHGALLGLHLGWLFFGDVAKVAKWIALQGPKAVLEFVKDTLEWLTDVDVCQLIGFAYDVAVIIEPIFHDLVGATEWICRHQGERLPSAVPDTPGYDKDWYPSATKPPDIHPRLSPGLDLPILLRPVN